MNWLTILIGVAAVLFGIYTLVVRAKAPEKFSKLEAMKQAWGEKGGLFLHIAGYTLAPIFVGISFILAGIQGVALFGP